MRLKSTILNSFSAIILFLLFSCTKKTDTFQTDSINDYLQLAAGKYITYRIDSTVFTNFGRNTEIHSYQVKHVIESKITDNLGRPSYRVYRYLRDTAGTTPWVAAGSYFITPLDNQLEVIENNLRFIKMHAPIIKDYKWRGNAYLGDAPYSSLFSFTNDDEMDLWDYKYENINDVFKYNQTNLSNVVDVLQVDEKFSLDTVNVVNNKAVIPTNSEAAYLKGNGNPTDTIIITATKPAAGHERLTIYNQTKQYAVLNKIKIPPGLALYYEYDGNEWSYPNPLTITNNKVFVPKNAFIAYIFGKPNLAPTLIDMSLVDTNQTKKIAIFNRSDSNAVLNNISIPKGFGRNFELKNGQWTYADATNVLLDTDPYISDLPFGSTNYGLEKYAKNIGLVYKEFIMWDYQPNPGGAGGAYKTGFGIKMWMIDHN